MSDNSKIILLPRFLHVEYAAMERLGISMSEYQVASSVHTLSSKPSNPVCTMPSEEIGKFHFLSKRTVLRAFKVLLGKELIERVLNDDASHRGWKSTDKWWRAVEMAERERKEFYGDKKSPGRKPSDKKSPDSGELAPEGGRESPGGGKMAPNNNSNTPDIENTPTKTKGGFGIYNLAMNRYVANFSERTGHGPSEEQIQKHYEKLKRGE